ncbi:MAG: hypothetical protein JNJ59_02725 [Deltaproteobacteria bacterium]|jgi:hypothetical protein|nr:hypothetical protein [Deltaproteobacteria bacterium]
MRTSLSIILALPVFAFAACGDDNTGGVNCGAGTIDVNGQCVVDNDTSNPQDTLTGNDTTTTTDTSTNPTDTFMQDTNVQTDTTTSECTPAEADKGFVGAPCTRNCECQQNVKGQPLFCYKGFYQQGFGFCTDYAGNRTGLATLSEFDGVDTIPQFPGDCFPNVPAADRNKSLYVLLCNSVAACQAVGSAYDMCGTTGLAFSPGSRGTYCPTASGSNRTLTLNNTCLVSTTSPFNGNAVK